MTYLNIEIVKMTRPLSERKYPIFWVQYCIYGFNVHMYMYNIYILVVYLQHFTHTSA